jgi:phosphatidylserine/phosphatidylglycerophosphate/cardiolipin synthase-like enzyme
MQTFKPIVGADFPKVVIPLIDEAKQSIDIVVYDWRWYMDDPGGTVQRFNSALVRACKRGVIVRAVLNSSDILPILNECGIEARKMREKRCVHGKMLIIDKEKLVIGSHNFTKNAFGLNLEISLLTDIPEGNERLVNLFENMFNI